MKIRTFIFTFMAVISLQFVGAQQRITLILDPGHGGHDPGHCSNHAGHAAEKEINLKIALYVGEYIEKYLQNVDVIYTRKDDSYPTLDERVVLANSKKAHYFVSIHCNGAENPNARGTETHIHTFDNKKAADFARNIETEFTSRAGRPSRGVKDEKDLQHSLQVLKYTTMTSILVECGFLTNKEEGDFLNTTYGQELIASGIYRAFRTSIESEYPAIAFRKNGSTPVQNPAPENVLAANPSPKNTTAAEKAFAIQIAASKQAIPTDDYFFKKSGLPVARKELNTSSAYKYVYLAGEFEDRNQAEEVLAELRTKGYKDALIVSM
jgi:N-acetylmuramoyl-L-alanine amidase